MTKDEAIDILHRISEDNFYGTHVQEACKMAVEALSKCALPSNLDEFFFRSEPELTEFETAIEEYIKAYTGIVQTDVAAKQWAAKLLELAREQLIKDGYVIEKKAFHDAVENVEPETNVLINMTIDYALHAKKDGDRHAEMDCEEFKRLFHKYYDKGKEDALKKIEQDPESSYAFKRGVEYGKEEALKHLPRWRKASSGTKLPAESVIRSKGSDPRYGIVAVNDSEYITINDLNRLPKEDKK